MKQLGLDGNQTAEEDEDKKPPPKPKDPTMTKSGIVKVSFNHLMAIPDFIDTQGFKPPQQERRLSGIFSSWWDVKFSNLSAKLDLDPDNDDRYLQSLPYCDETDDYKDFENSLYDDAEDSDEGRRL